MSKSDSMERENVEKGRQQTALSTIFYPQTHSRSRAIAAHANGKIREKLIEGVVVEYFIQETFLSSLSI